MSRGLKVAGQHRAQGFLCIASSGRLPAGDTPGQSGIVICGDPVKDAFPVAGVKKAMGRQGVVSWRTRKEPPPRRRFIPPFDETARRGRVP